jgi:hypothetical protein
MPVWSVVLHNMLEFQPEEHEGAAVPTITSYASRANNVAIDRTARELGGRKHIKFARNAHSIKACIGKPGKLQLDEINGCACEASDLQRHYSTKQVCAAYRSFDARRKAFLSMM